MIIPEGFGQIIHQLRLAGDAEPMAVTYGVDIDAGGIDEGALDATLNAIHDAFRTATGPYVSNQYTLFSTELRWNDGGPALRVGIHVEPVAMAGTEGALPQNSAILVQKRSSSAGRRNRGRFYLPGVSELNVGPTGLLLGATAGNLQTALATFLNTLNTGIPQIDGMVILHDVGVSGAPAPTPVTQLLVDAVIATQRRRLRK